MKPKKSMARSASQPAVRQEKEIIKPEGKYPDPQPPDLSSSDHTPRDATGINSEHMRPIDPNSPYIPPA
ncbi:MAG TPA: hypothetical protein VNO14_02230 [Blastocatellia bacterium]|nr:hypothetical protein [Blastocatellia bacterium]